MGQHEKHWPLVKFAIFWYFLLCSVLQADCRQALAIGLDVSGSVDAREYRLQMDGLAAALQHVDVKDALFAMPSTPVHLAVYEWSGPQDQHLIAGWTRIEDLKALNQFSARLRATKRTIGAPATAVGNSMLYGAALLSKQSDCWTHTLDLSADGPSNSGPRPREIKRHPLLQKMTVNALVIKAAQKDLKGLDLTKYYRSEVILGPTSFAQEAIGFEAFEAAMVQKLLRELQGLAVSGLQL